MQSHLDPSPLSTDPLAAPFSLPEGGGLSRQEESRMGVQGRALGGSEAGRAAGELEEGEILGIDGVGQGETGVGVPPSTKTPAQGQPQKRKLREVLSHEDLAQPLKLPKAGAFRRRLNYRHTAKMAQATDLPIELIDLILSSYPEHAEQVQWRRRAAAIGERTGRRCGRVTLAMWDYEEQKAWVIQRWGYWGPRHWAIAGFFVLCPCDAMIGNYFGRYWFV
ncbi:hypothetical protein AGABI2DRAFT_144525 [Agaricus bisporus var. bisporus H97]|uniref:hypothetical protein n=1 Tax=Agaricus bisporus var. bisporus (strain H97 / ATCC MYA-4626 / FGSC 10389) TaxID=936046 RepID=UPI00029F6837|nr:hypothetical protein AGABI2DRAFT_144525 [Agaricus bisporus var. bisporus H97]EKV44995.1 hypothetical protein AGABI2DRAFT_144525 [Agaricus bisporus var. bisporus H97]